MPLFQVILPSNCGLFFKQVMEIAAFDFYEFGDIIHSKFEIEETEPVSEGFEQIGFESQYFLVNMGTMVIFYAIYLLCFLIAPVLRACRGCSKFIKRRSKKLDAGVYWGNLITLLQESYMIIIVCVLINIQIFSMDSLGLQVMSILCATFLALLIILPIVFIWRLERNF